MTTSDFIRRALLLALLLPATAETTFDLGQAKTSPSLPVEYGGGTLRSGAATFTWKVPDSVAPGNYWIEFLGSSLRNRPEFGQSPESEPFRFSVAAPDSGKFEIKAFSFEITPDFVEEVANHTDAAFGLPHLITTRRSDHAVALEPGASLRFESRWDRGLAGELRLVAAEDPIAVSVIAEASATMHLFDEKTPVKFTIKVTGLGDAPANGLLEWEIIDAVEGKCAGERQTLEIPAGEVWNHDLQPKLPVGAYTLHLRWKDAAGKMVTHLQRHFSYSHHIAAADLPDDWPFGWHMRPGDPLVPPVGLKMLRLFTGWRDMQPERDQYRWEEMDQIVAYAKEHGHPLLWIFTHIPRWASSNPTGPTYGRTWRNKDGELEREMPYEAFEPRDYQDLRDFLTAFWERYGDSGTIKAVEIFNEPNVYHQHGMGIEGYLRVAKEIHGFFRRVAPEVRLVGISESGGLHTNWVNGVMEAGLGKYIDAASSHGYEVGTPRGGVSIETKFQRLREALDGQGLKDAPMWDTEAGVASFGRWGGRFVPELESEKAVRSSVNFNPDHPNKLGSRWRSGSPWQAGGWLVRSAAQKRTLGVEQIHWFKLRAHGFSWVHDYEPGGNVVPALQLPVHSVMAKVMLTHGLEVDPTQPEIESPDERFWLFAHRFTGPQGRVTVIYAHPKKAGFAVGDELVGTAGSEGVDGRAPFISSTDPVFTIPLEGVRPGAYTMDILGRQRADARQEFEVKMSPVYLIEPAP